MNRIGILLVAMLLSAHVCAENMMHLLQGGYDAKVMSPAEMDEVMRRDGEEDNNRWRLEWENEDKLFRHSFLAD